MFDHVKFGVTDFAASKAFYLQALEPLGVGEARASPPGIHGRESPAGRSGRAQHRSGLPRIRSYAPRMIVFKETSLLLAVLCFTALAASAQPTTQVVDVPTRDGVTVRVLHISPPQPKATLLLLIGGNGGMQITPDGKWKWGGGNFLMRSRQLFVDQGVAVGIVDAPSDRQQPPYLDFFRTTSAHVADLKAVIAWARSRSPVPVWLVGTSRGTESAAYAATQLQGAAAPDGIVLSSTILRDPKGQPVTAMSLGRIQVPVLVVHHEEDACRLCPFSDVPGLMDGLSAAPRKQVLSFKGGESRGEPCEAFAHHGYNGQEAEVVAKMVAWVVAK